MTKEGALTLKEDALRQLVVFRLDKEEYGIEVSTVREIHDMEDVAKEHRAASHIEGVVNLRGKLLTAVNLRKRFDMKRDGATNPTTVVRDATQEVENLAKVLVVDDSEFMRKVLRNILEAGGHKVIEARSADEALDRFVKESPEIVTMDIVMPDKDGIEAVKRLKEANAKAKIIMISALGHQKTVMRSLEAGAVDFIIKPFTADDVLGAVNAVLQMGL